MTDMFDLKQPPVFMPEPQHVREPVPAAVEAEVPVFPEPAADISAEDSVETLEPFLTGSELAMADDFDLAEYDPVSAVMAAMSAPSAVAWEADHKLPEQHRTRHLLLIAALGVAGIGVAYWQQSWITLAVVLVGVGVLELRERHGKPFTVHIHEEGLTVGNQHYKHADLASFDMHQMRDGSVHLSVKTNHWHSPRLSIPLGNQDPVEVHTVMSQYVKKEAHQVHPVEWWVRKG